MANLIINSCQTVDSYDKDGIRAEIWLDTIKTGEINKSKTIGVLNLKLTNQTDKDITIKYLTIGNPQIMRHNLLLTQNLSYEVFCAVSREEVPKDYWELYNCYSNREAIDDSSDLPLDLISKIKDLDYVELKDLNNKKEITTLARNSIINELVFYFRDKIKLSKSEVYKTCFWLRLSSFPDGDYKIFIKYPNEITSRSIHLINILDDKLGFKLENYDRDFKDWKGTFTSNVIKFTKQ